MTQPTPPETGIIWNVEDDRLTLTDPARSKPFQPDDPAEGLLSFLIAVAQSDAPHVHPDDAPRYAAMLSDFLAFSWVRHRYCDQPDETITVADASISEAMRMSRQWIKSKVGGDDRLGSSFALDAVAFIQAHVYGEHLGKYQGEHIELRSLMADPYDNALIGHEQITPQIKMKITESDVGGLLIRAKIPEGGRLVDTKQHVRGIAGDIFMMLLRRCHLSQSMDDDQETFIAEESEAEGADLGRFARFYGGIPCTTRPWPSPRVNLNDLPEDLSKYLAQSPEDAQPFNGLGRCGFPLTLPLRWITETWGRDGWFARRVGGAESSMPPNPRNPRKR